MTTISNNTPSATSGYGNGIDPNSGTALGVDFITLMVAQVQNQDPLEPTDPSQFVTQLAQISQVQGTEKLSLLMQQNLVALDNQQVLMSAGLVGQDVMAYTDTVSLSGDTVSGKVNLPSSASNLELVLTDDFGQETVIPLGNGKDLAFEINPKELGLEDGQYNLTVRGDELETVPNIGIAGTAEKVSLPANGTTMLVHVQGIGEVPIYDIFEFRTPA